MLGPSVLTPAGLGSLTRPTERGARIHPGTLVTTKAVSSHGVPGLASRPTRARCQDSSGTAGCHQGGLTRRRAGSRRSVVRRRSASGDAAWPRPACGRTQLGAEACSAPTSPRRVSIPRPVRRPGGRLGCGVLGDEPLDILVSVIVWDLRWWRLHQVGARTLQGSRDPVVHGELGEPDGIDDDAG